MADCERAERAPLLREDDAHERRTVSVSSPETSTSSRRHRASFLLGVGIVGACAMFSVAERRGAFDARGGAGVRTLDARSMGVGALDRDVARAGASNGYETIRDPVVGADGARAGATTYSRDLRPMDVKFLENERGDAELTPAGERRNVHLTLYTACGNLASLPFRTGAWTGVVGARVATKSQSNDFFFHKAQEMTQTRCGTFETDIALAPGEEFGFYLYDLAAPTDANTVSDIGCLRRGGGRCPGFASPAALEGLESCTKTTDEGDDVFYNRVFDGSQTEYVYGSCDVACSDGAPRGCAGRAGDLADDGDDASAYEDPVDPQSFLH